ncbi:MAG: hypothetical protein WCY01_09890 [Alkalispirochaeta sp.]
MIEYRGDAPDPEGTVRRQERDVRGNIVAVTDYPDGETLTIGYTYNAVGEMTTVVDPEDNVITVEYDTLGRRTALTTPDSGRTEYEFDLAGNLTRRVDKNMRSRGK